MTMLDPTSLDGYSEWSLLSACKKKENADVDWLVEGMTLPAVEMRTKAVRICNEECPVREQCHEWGLLHEKFGVWGGHIQSELKRERRQRRIVMDIPGSFILDARRVYYAEGVDTLPSYLNAHSGYRGYSLNGEPI